MTRTNFDVVIVGGGIAGASLAYFLAEKGMTDVLLLEREEQHGYHSTGRSAAVLAELDLVPELLELKVQAAAFLRRPPAGFCERPLLEPHGILVAFQEPHWSAVRPLVALLEQRGATVQALSPSEVVDRIPVLLPRCVDGGIWLPEDGHIDVHELLWGYLRGATRRGAERRCGVEVRGVRTESGRVSGVETSAGSFGARWVVDAAGAWASRVAAMAGASPIPIRPHRRTIVTFAPPDGIDVRSWPLVSHESHRLYFGPESGGLLASPMDEEPVEPGDARPEEIMIAQTIERLAAVAPALVPKSLRRSWAGLRSFAPDRVLVVGEDPRLSGFFWLAGQGGCGIETSPAVGRIAADLLAGGAATGIARRLDPARFVSASASAP